MSPFHKGPLLPKASPVQEGLSLLCLSYIRTLFHRKPPVQGEVSAKLTVGLLEKQSPADSRRLPPLHKGA